MSTNLIRNQLDTMLFEEGSFTPLNWLLREGHLNYNDYQNWKKGTYSYLEDHFKSTCTNLVADLEEAHNYATLLKLEPCLQTYSSIHNQPLHFCRAAAHETIFTTVFEPAQDRIQMDLFFDSADSNLVSNLISVIIDQRSEEISDLLSKLQALNPDKARKFKQLLGFEHKVFHANINSDKKIAIILEQASPLSYEILGRFTHEFLTPLWHKVSDEISDQKFDAKFPYRHLSFTAFNEFQWQIVHSSIEREKNWHKQPLLIFRYAEASFKLNREQEGLNHWFKLFIIFPEEAEQLMKESCNRLMFSDWCLFSELDPKLNNTLFPAWLVMNRPALAGSTATSCISDNEPLQLIEQLIQDKDQVINELTVKHRSMLQKIYPALFIQYMKTVTKGAT